MKNDNINPPIHELEPFTLFKPKGDLNPFIFNSPHSGRYYPDRFLKLSKLPKKTLRISEDAYVDKLFANVCNYGSPLLSANYPRAYVDLNREPQELDPSMFSDRLPSSCKTKSSRIAVGLGTIPKAISLEQMIYAQKLNYFEEKSRLHHIYLPYHAELQRLLVQTKAKFGWVALIDCHSMPSLKQNPDIEFTRKLLGNPPAPELDPDIVLGDRYASSCSIHLTNILERLFKDMGYNVTRNDPYAGGYCTEFYGRPKNGTHAIQIEINRKLYMNEKSVELRPTASKKLIDDITSIMAELTGLNLLHARPRAAE